MEKQNISRNFQLQTQQILKTLLFDYKNYNKKAIEKFSKISTKDCKRKILLYFHEAILYQLTETKNTAKFFTLS